MIAHPDLESIRGTQEETPTRWSTMPTVWSDGRYRIFFYSDEGLEPPHVHIESAERRAKDWIHPIDLVWNDGFRSGELKEIARILTENQAAFLRAWNDYFGI